VHDREDLAVTGGPDVWDEALQYVTTLQHPQRLMIRDRHQRIIAHGLRLSRIAQLRVTACEDRRRQDARGTAIPTR
jgi:hypothetical protein